LPSVPLSNEPKAGIGLDDAPMKPLKPSYAKWKQKVGLGNERNLVGMGNKGGHLLEQPRVTYADDNNVKIDITTRSGRDKARGNQKRATWWGFSPSDTRKIVERARQLFKANVASFPALLGGRPSLSGLRNVLSNLSKAA